MNDLQKIKDKYGEKMMHLCRELFPTILETPGLLFELLSTHFDYNRNLYYDIIDRKLTDSFKGYIYGLINNDIENEKSTKNPFDLMREAGYTLYECKSEKDIQKFKKYYAHGEELCTFRSNRLENCYVFFAVRDDANRLKRKDFTYPLRQDAYGTSVISIQFSRGKSNILSIKNRYNHTVENPDATFSNNLENIIPGLSESFEKEYGFNIQQNRSTKFELPGYVSDSKGKYYKYNLEINNIYYCDNNVIIDNFNKIDDFKEKERYIFADCYIIDLKEKKVFVYDSRLNNDGFLFGLMGADSIEVKKQKDSKLIILKTKNQEDRIIEINNHNQIIGYKNNITTFVGSKFMYNNKHLKYIEMQNVDTIGKNFLYDNRAVEKIIMPKLIKVDNFFFRKNNSLKELDLPNLLYTGTGFLESNEILEKISLPNIETVNSDFLQHNKELKEIDFPYLLYAGEAFLECNRKIHKVNLPNLEHVYSRFLCLNEELTEIDLPKLKNAGDLFLAANNKIETICLPSLEYVNNAFMAFNANLRELILPNVKFMSPSMLKENENLCYIYIPCIEKYPFGPNDTVNLLLKKLLLEKFNNPKKLKLSIN